LLVQLVQAATAGVHRAGFAGPQPEPPTTEPLSTADCGRPYRHPAQGERGPLVRDSLCPAHQAGADAVTVERLPVVVLKPRLLSGLIILSDPRPHRLGIHARTRTFVSTTWS
jgi:hypothetical protein